jgi:YHS domain-containing protein
MNRIFHHARFVFAFVALTSLLVTAASAHDKHKNQKAQKQGAKADKKATAFMGKGDGIESCPVTGEPISSKEVKGEFFGRTVYFCCEDCLADAQKNPAKYVKKTEAAQIAATKHLPKAEGHGHHSEHHAQASGEEKKFLGKGDGVETCPVTGEKADKEVKAEIEGRTVYFCCAECIDTVKKNPELYLKKSEKP